VCTFLGHAGVVRDVALHPDGRRAASAGDDGRVRLWDAVTGREVLTLAGHAGPVANVRFTRDGERLVSTGSDGSVRIWDVQSGQGVLTLRRELQVPGGLALSPDGRYLAAGRGDGAYLKVWDGGEPGPEAGADQAVAWHAGEADGYEALGKWEAAVYHLGRLAEARPGEAELHSRRAWVCFQAGRRAEAAAASAKALALGLDPADVGRVGWQPAWLRWHLGDAAEYRRLCAALLERNAAADPAVASMAARMCVLSPGAPDPARVVALAQSACAQAPGNQAYRERLGVAYYRAGDWRAARAELAKSRPGRSCAGNFFLAMADWHLGDAERARQSYDRAVGWMEKHRELLEKDPVTAAELGRFRAEAEALMGAAGAK
jgi:tetratricopeptide (TPR) repeat protein